MSRVKSGPDSFTDAHALHVVDTSRAKDGVWLVKVPKYLAELWRNAGPDGLVGKVVIASAPTPPAAATVSTTNMGTASDKTKKPGSQVTLVTDAELLARAGEHGGLIPKEHQFLIQTSTPSTTAGGSRSGGSQSAQRRVGAMSGQELVILAEDDLAVASAATTTIALDSTNNTTAHGSSSSRPESPFSNSPSARYSRRLSLFGRVNSRAECRPPPNTRYMMLKAQQLKAMNRPKHEVRLLYEPVRNYKPVANHVNNLEYDARKRAEGKNLRREKEDVMQDLFKAFERHQYYAIRDLILLTKQPVTYLTDILKEIAIFNARAPHKNMWELKPEYRHYAAQESSKADEPTVT
ncbi:Transcription initiation factor TFIIF subunit beta [Paragonimus heterotremus]|uniref:General transcription factor IIF subunit 2 n=1 Tax=Paragonimus heterotremus TaxID=100268 RepID=A0A8J4SPN1_9TREM|nr:Transcription initiation factor TFIIF subunit beta [Paragonimus heterotremus]